jgi:hypothetical protein
MCPSLAISIKSDVIYSDTDSIKKLMVAFLVYQLYNNYLLKIVLHKQINKSTS